MKKINLIFIGIILALFTSISMANSVPLTKYMVQKAIDNMLISAQNKDTYGITKYMSKDIKINLILPPHLGGEFNLDLSQYKSLLNIGWGMRGYEYNYEIKDIKITLNKNGKEVVVTDTMIERMIANGKPYKSTSTKETITFKYKDNKLLIVKMTCVAKEIPNH